jgi:hypothetical protein
MTRATAKQMELFEDGGLKDEGGTVDPVSGNDVPPGSTKAEVRDDIPAQLSEGEFVFPADVVRFIGLEKLMKIRQRAKAGLKRMEDMGQMGNSEEAIMPDDLPFSIDDLDMEDDGLEMNVGGLIGSLAGNVTPMPGGSPGGPIGSFNPQIPGTAGMNPLGTAAAPMQAASASAGGFNPNLAGTVFTPTNTQPTFPTYQQTVGPGVVDVDYENVTFTHPDGRTIVIRRNKRTGEYMDPIPEGFVAGDSSKAPAASTRTQTTQVTGDEGDDTFDQDQADMQRDQARVDAAKALGYTDFVGFGQGLAAALGYTTLPQGKVTGIGFIADGKGNLIDPTTGLVVPQGLLNSIKTSANLVVDTLKYGTDKPTAAIIAKGVGSKDPFVREVRTRMAGAKVKEQFKNIRDDIKDGKYTSDFATSKGFEDYIDDVEKSIEAEVARGNVDFQTGSIINPFEASGGANRGVSRDVTIGVGMNEGQTSTPTPTTTPDYSYTSYEPGGGDNEGTSDPGSSGASNEGGQADSGAGGGQVGSEEDGFDGNKGGLVSQMKRSGLASKK